MSGHSKWATIHRQKEVKDAKKGAAFTKMAAAITVAVRAGGGIGDSEKNFRLRLAIEKARQFNMPKENISRAIEKGVGGVGVLQLDEAMYEGFGPGGVAILVETLTDNKVRTSQQVRLLFDRGGGTMGSTGTVNYLFTQLGEIRIKNNGLGEVDELKIIDLNIHDLEKDADSWSVFCFKDSLVEIKEALEVFGYTVEAADLIMRSNMPMEIVDSELCTKIENLLHVLEDSDDVTHVWTNYA